MLAVEAFDATVAGLYDVGSVFSADRGTGYGAANLAVFVGAWPLLLLSLWFTAVRQRARLSRPVTSSFKARTQGSGTFTIIAICARLTMDSIQAE